jgi:hypothetical protein
LHAKNISIWATSASRFMTGRALKNFIIGDDSTAENRVSTIFSAVKILWLTGGNQLNCFICTPEKVAVRKPGIFNHDHPMMGPSQSLTGCPTLSSRR